MKKIIVTTDLSPESFSAFRTAKKYAHSDGETATIVVLCVLEDLAKTSVQFALGFAFLDTEGAFERMYKDVSAKLAKVVEEHFSGEKVEQIIIPAAQPVSRAILDFAATEKADMIVMATHGHTGIRHLILGSVVERVVRESDRPVLVVPATSPKES